MNQVSQAQPSGSFRRALRVLWPLGAATLLILALLGYRTHQRWMAQTRLRFAAYLPGESVFTGVGELDGKPFASGGLVSLGPHRLRILDPKAEPFVAEFWVWHGGRDFGSIELVRAHGTLAVSADPPAARLTIQGPEFSVTLTNSPGMTSAVPADVYAIEIRYPYWREQQEVTVRSRATESRRFNPKFGAMRIESNRPGVAFALHAGDDRVVQRSKAPATLAGLPVGSYRVAATYQSETQEMPASVTAGQTNSVLVSFSLGSALIVSEPPGAEVVSKGGRRWGLTPALVHDVPPGKWEFQLRKDGHVPAVLTVEILADQTNRAQLTLVNAGYAQAMMTAREYLARGDPGGAVRMLEQALGVKSADPEATSLLQQALVAKHLKDANALLGRQRFAEARAAVQQLLSIEPDHAEGSALLRTIEDALRQVAMLEEQRAAEQLRQRNLAALRRMFDKLQEEFRPDGATCAEHEMRVEVPANAVRSAVYKSLIEESPRFDVSFPEVDMQAGLFGIVATQELPGGLRRCLIAAAPTGEKETRLLFKVLEYKSATALKLSFRIAIGGTPAPPAPRTFTHLAPTATDLTAAERSQVQEGQRIVTQRLKNALNPSP